MKVTTQKMVFMRKINYRTNGLLMGIMKKHLKVKWEL
jgi:hypothetical protein